MWNLQQLVKLNNYAMGKSKQIFIEDRSKREEIPIHFQEDYELESAKLFYSTQEKEEYWYINELKLLEYGEC